MKTFNYVFFKMETKMKVAEPQLKVTSTFKSSPKACEAILRLKLQERNRIELIFCVWLFIKNIFCEVIQVLTAAFKQVNPPHASTDHTSPSKTLLATLVSLSLISSY